MDRTIPQTSGGSVGPEFIRNVCILAHVDHGKTTIADLMVATNGHISKRIAGNVRYLDDRKDEQERGITMKTSAISLSYITRTGEKYIVNLIDTPGHIDFSTEVSAAVRICDGALIIVDIIEGVCVQTKESIKQAFDERVKMILIINKMDRIILEQQKTVSDMYQLILRIIEDCNAFIAQLFLYDVQCTMSEDEYLFSPVKGNVIFGSAIDGWGVTTENIASMFSAKFPDYPVEVLNKAMWKPDLYISKGKIVKGAIEKNKQNIFITMFLNTIYFIYYNLRVRNDQSQYDIIIDKLQITYQTIDMRHSDPKVQVKAILEDWQPMAFTIFRKIRDLIPSPTKHVKDRYEYLINTKQYFGNEELTRYANKMVDSLTSCLKSDNFTYIYVSKMFPVSKTIINQKKVAIAAAIRKKRREKEAASSSSTDATEATLSKQEPGAEHSSDSEHEGANDAAGGSRAAGGSHAASNSEAAGYSSTASGSQAAAGTDNAGGSQSTGGSNVAGGGGAAGGSDAPGGGGVAGGGDAPATSEAAGDGHTTVDSGAAGAIDSAGGSTAAGSSGAPAWNVDTTKLPYGKSKSTLNTGCFEIVGLARVFSGMIKTRQTMYVLHPDYKPPPLDVDLAEFISKSNQITEVTIKKLYILLGRDLIETDSVAAGNICGMRGLKNKMGRMGTLSSTPYALPLNERMSFEPVIRNAIECKCPGDIPILKEGLKFLKKVDSCVQVVIQESGEFVLITAGDVHLAKCIEDITTMVSNIDIKVSEPMVSLKETVKTASKKTDFAESSPYTVHLSMKEIGLTMGISVVPLPEQAIMAVQHNFELLRLVEEYDHKRQPEEEVFCRKPYGSATFMCKLTEHLTIAFQTPPEWATKWEHIWSVGKHHDSINVLFNMTPDYNRNIFHTLNKVDVRSTLDHCIINGFDMVCRAGPICEEPMSNCAFIVSYYKIANPLALDDTAIRMQVTATLPTLIRDQFREAIAKQLPRLMEPMFLASIQVTTRILGKVYKVVNRHHGKVTESIGMDDEEKVYMVKAEIPVLECQNLANDVRTDTSGNANISLRFSRYQVIEGDPYFKEDENDSDSDNEGADIVSDSRRACQIRTTVRKRKGLRVDDQVIVHGEKQRTLQKKK